MSVRLCSLMDECTNAQASPGEKNSLGSNGTKVHRFLDQIQIVGWINPATISCNWVEKVQDSGLPIRGVGHIEQRIEHFDAKGPAIQERRVQIGTSCRSQLLSSHQKCDHQVFGGSQQFHRQWSQPVLNGSIESQTIGKDPSQVKHKLCDRGVIVLVELALHGRDAHGVLDFGSIVLNNVLVADRQ